MILIALVALLGVADGDGPRHATIVQSTVVRIRQKVARIIAKPPAPPHYRERKGPHCIVAADIAAAAVTTPDSVDFSLRGGDRMRAHLESECPALDYYSGFYVTPQPDGRICADRDAIRTRSGGECGIDRFRRLVPAKP